MFEVEEGRRADRSKLEYHFDVNVFPSFSWKGYVPFSPEQVHANTPQRTNIKNITTVYYKFKPDHHLFLSV